MNRIKLGGHVSHLALACAATALLAAGCNRSQTAATSTAAPPLDALPLTTAATPAAAPAPPASALPPAAPARLGRLVRPQDGYAYLDRAHAASDGYADAPPDYAVDYDGERPWIWRGGDNSERVVERTPDGLRYYYYEPGASEPYLIQDPNYGYAYSDGQLVAVYGQDGELQPYEVQRRYADRAGRYLAWAAGLYAASQHQQREAVEQDRWREQRADIAGQRAAWGRQQGRYQAWNDYHQAHAQEETAHWVPERDRRQAELVRYGAPQGGGPQGQGPQAGVQRAAYQGGGYQNGGYQNGPPQGAPLQGDRFQGDRFQGAPPRGDVQGQDRDPFRQGGQPNGYPPAGTPQSGYGYDPNGVRNAAAQGEARRRAGFDQHAAEIQAQRQAAEQAHAAQMQAMRSQQLQAQAAEGQRQAAMQQARGQAEAQRQAAQQAHAAQMGEQRAQAQAQHEAAMQQARGQAEAQRQAAMQQAQAANAQRAAAMQQARGQAEAQRQAAMQQAQAVNAQRQAAAQQQAHQAQAQAAQRAAAPHPGGPPPQGGPHGDREHRGPGEQR